MYLYKGKTLCVFIYILTCREKMDLPKYTSTLNFDLEKKSQISKGTLKGM